MKPIKAVANAVLKPLKALGKSIIGGESKSAAAPALPAATPEPPPAPAAVAPPAPPIAPIMAPVAPPSPPTPAVPDVAKKVEAAAQAQRAPTSRRKTLYSSTDYTGVMDGAKDLSAENKSKRPRTLYGS